MNGGACLSENLLQSCLQPQQLPPRSRSSRTAIRRKPQQFAAILTDTPRNGKVHCPSKARELDGRGMVPTLTESATRPGCRPGAVGGVGSLAIETVDPTLAGVPSTGVSLPVFRLCLGPMRQSIGFPAPWPLRAACGRAAAMALRGRPRTYCRAELRQSIGCCTAA